MIVRIKFNYEPQCFSSLANYTPLIVSMQITIELLNGQLDRLI